MRVATAAALSLSAWLAAPAAADSVFRWSQTGQTRDDLALVNSGMLISSRGEFAALEILASCATPAAPVSLAIAAYDAPRHFPFEPSAGVVKRLELRARGADNAALAPLRLTATFRSPRRLTIGPDDGARLLAYIGETKPGRKGAKVVDAHFFDHFDAPVLSIVSVNLAAALSDCRARWTRM